MVERESERRGEKKTASKKKNKKKTSHYRILRQGVLTMTTYLSVKRFANCSGAVSLVGLRSSSVE